MVDLAIPCMVMRGGTSKSPLFLATDLPADAHTRDQLLLSMMGSPDIRQIDGLGGGDSLTSQVLIVNRAASDNADIDYLFAQVGVARGEVDTTPNCGNMLAAVACFAIERGLVTPIDDITRVRMYNLNTRRLVEAHVPTPNGRVTYEGNARIDGVPGTGAGIVLDFVNPAGAGTGRLLPTGNSVDLIDGVPISCVDFAIPTVLIPARALGKAGYESKAELDSDAALLATVERIRRKAAALMGLPDAGHSVLPKVTLLAPPREGGTISSRFYVPWNCHVAHSTTGALCIAAATLIRGTVAAGLAAPARREAPAIVIEHPSGGLCVRVELEKATHAAHASVVLTARPLFDGCAFVRRPLKAVA